MPTILKAPIDQQSALRIVGTAGIIGYTWALNREARRP